MNDSLPKLCECGCGQPAPIATRNRTDKGWVKGQPKRFVYGHQHRISGRKKYPETYMEVDRGHVTPCWIWQGRIHREYAVAGKPRRRMHRVFYELAHGPIPDGLEPDHLCKQKSCVNPDHLEAVTHTENMRRARDVKITMDDAREIRRLFATGEYTKTALAKQYGILLQSVWLIINDKQWRE